MKFQKLELLTLGLTLVALAFLTGWFLSRQDQARQAFVPSPALPTATPSQPLLPEPSQPLININTATAETLATLPGIGEKKAAAIVAYREEHGPFPVIEALTDVPGIGETIFNQCQGFLTVED